MKIVSSGKVLNSQKFYDRKRKIKRLKILASILGLVVFLALLVYLSRHESVLVKTIVVSPEEVIDRREIVQSVESKIAGYYGWLVPRNNALFLPRADIKTDLLKKFSRLKSVSLSLEGLNSLRVVVVERSPYALYCLNEDNLECYFFDKESFIFALAPSFSEPIYLIYHTENSFENPVGKRLMSIQEFVSLEAFVKKLTSLDIHASAFKIGGENFTLIMPSGGEVVWRRGSDLPLLYSNLEAFLTSEVIKGQANFLEKISVLDLRTENKVFYKFRE